MRYKKLSKGFLVTDLKEPKTSSGLVRLAPKVLRGSAEQLTRSSTYMFALQKMEIAGASGAINSEPAQKRASLASFLSEISSMVSTQSFLPDAGKGLSEEDLSPIRAGDPRPEVRLTEMFSSKKQDGKGDCKLYQFCTGVSAASGISELLNGVEGKNVSIEGFNANAYGALKTLADTGINLIGISCGNDSVIIPEGIDIAEVLNSWEEHGSDFLNHNNFDLQPAKDIFSTPTDILFVGSKIGAIEHNLADKLDISALVSLHPIPYTTKALIILDRKGVVVPPDFLCLGGQIMADYSSSKSPEEIIKTTADKTKELAAEMDALKKDIQSEGPALFLAGCKMAEDFLLTWQEELPFGRPTA